jgi:hypothetical protein
MVCLKLLEKEKQAIAKYKMKRDYKNHGRNQ